MNKHWLSEHLEEFVKPKLGTIPKLTKTTTLSQARLENLLKIWNATKKACGSKTLVLAGRDVQELEIFAGIDEFDREFRPDISMNTVHFIKKEKDWSDYYLVDSGFSGSIPYALGIKKWNMISGAKVLIPGDLQAIQMGSALEGFPKYWMRARMNSAKNGVLQPKSSLKTFTSCARNTRIIAKFYLKSLGA